MAYSVIVLYSMMKAPDDENGEVSQFSHLQDFEDSTKVQMTQVLGLIPIAGRFPDHYGRPALHTTSKAYGKKPHNLLFPTTPSKPFSNTAEPRMWMISRKFS